MRIRVKPFVLMGLVFTLTPLALTAKAPVPNRARLFASVHTSHATVKGVRVAARLDTTSRSTLAVDITAHNPSAKTVTAKLKVDVYERRPSSPMARMMPPPIHHGTRILKVKLAPRQKLSKKILLKGKPGVSAKNASRYYTVVRPAPKKARHAQQQRKARQAG